MEGIRSLKRKHWNSIFAGSFSWFFDAWDAFLLIYVLTDIAKSFGISTATASLAILFTYLSRWLGGIIFGVAATRIGRKKSLIISIAIFGVFTMLTGLATNLTMLLILRLCFGIGMGGLYATSGSLVIESVPNSVRGFASGLFMFGFYVGSAVSPITYYLLNPHFGWRGTFMFGGISLLLIPYILLTVQESPVWLERKKQLGSGNNIQEKPLPFWKVFSPAFIGTTIALLAVEFGGFSVGYPFQSMLPTFLKTIRHFPVGEVAFAGSMVGIGALVGSLIAGWISDKIGRKTTFIYAYVIGFIPLLIALFTKNPSLIIVAALVQGITANGGIGGLVTAFETENYPTDLRAAGNGFLHNLGSLGGSLGAVMAAYLNSTIGLGPAITAIYILGAVIGMIGIYFTKETKGIDLAQDNASSM